MAQSNLKQPMNQSFNVGGSLARSTSQPPFFMNNCLPPLSPTPPHCEPMSNLKEEMDVKSRVSPIGPSIPRENIFRVKDNLPPRTFHRRSSSDVPLGFSDMMHSSPQLVPISNQGVFGRVGGMREASGNEKPVGMKNGEMDDDLLNSLMNLDNEDKDKDSIISGVTELQNESRNVTCSREGVKRSATMDIAPPARHYRSLSMDSAFGKFNFGDESPKQQTSLSSPMSNTAGKINLDYVHSEFNEFELKKIMGDERLAEVAQSDPKRAKRILANRQSAARSKERKTRYISELEHKVQTLQTETTTLSAQITLTQKDYADLANQNNELKFRLHAMDQQAKLRDALNDALTAEVQRLKLANMALRGDDRTSNGNHSHQQGSSMINHHMFLMQRQQQQPNQMELFHNVNSTSSSTASAAPTSA